MATITYTDFEQVELKVGDKIHDYGSDLNKPGVVFKIDEPDWDYDDDAQCPQRYGPYVHVIWPDGSTEKFVGTLHSHGGNPYDDYENYEEEYIFDDLVKVG